MNAIYFARMYLSMLLQSGKHSVAAAYARNMATAKRQRQEQARRRNLLKGQS